MSVLRYWAAAKAAAGTADETLEGRTLAELLDAARTRHDRRFADVLGRCSYVVDGDPVGVRAHGSVVVTANSVVDVLPPFAGG